MQLICALKKRGVCIQCCKQFAGCIEPAGTCTAGDPSCWYKVEFEEPSGANPLVEMMMKVRPVASRLYNSGALVQIMVLSLGTSNIASAEMRRVQGSRALLMMQLSSGFNSGFTILGSRQGVLQLCLLSSQQSGTTHTHCMSASLMHISPAWWL